MLDGVVLLKAGHTLTFSDLDVTNMRYGPGAGADFLRGEGPRSVFLFKNVTWRRQVCLPPASTEEILQQQAVDPGASSGNASSPSKAQMQLEDTCTGGRCFPDSLHVYSASVLVKPKRGGDELAESSVPGGLSGSYSWDVFNMTRLCASTISKECLDAAGASSCYEQAFRTWEQQQDEQWPDPQHQQQGQPEGTSRRSVALGAGIGAGLAALLLLVAVTIAAWRRRRGRQRASLAVMYRGKGASGSDGSEVGTSRQERIRPNGTLSRSLGASGEPGNTPGSNWRLMGHVSSRAAVKEESAKALLDDVHLGVLLGAGSFGRVYKGRWCGRDVAVKVMLHHDIQLSKKIQSEIRLMLSFKHENIVEALHYVAWQKFVHTSADGTQEDDEEGSDDGFAPAAGDNYIPSDQASSIASSSASQPSQVQAQVQTETQPASQPSSSHVAFLPSLPRQPCNTLSAAASLASLPAAGRPTAPQQQRSAPPWRPVHDKRRPPARAASYLGFGPARRDANPGLEIAGRASLSGEALAGRAQLIAEGAAGSSSRPAGAAAASTGPSHGRRMSCSVSFPSAGGAGRGDPATNRHLVGLMASAQLPSAPAVNGWTTFLVEAGDCDGSGVVPPPAPGADASGDLVPCGTAGPCRSAPGGAGEADSCGDSCGNDAGRASFASREDGGGSGSAMGGSSRAAGGHPGRKQRQVAQGEAQTWLVLEYCSEGSLADALRSGALHRDAEGQCGTDTLPTDSSPAVVSAHRSSAGSSHGPDSVPSVDMPRALELLLDVTRGMAYLHSRNVVHADLKCQNVLLTRAPDRPWDKMVAKITDFGLSKALGLNQTHVTTHSMGTVTHMPPELFKTGRMSPAGDVYAFGVMAWEVLTGCGAFHGMHYAEVIEQVAIRGVRPPIPEATLPELRAMIEACWQADPTKRPGFDTLVTCLELLLQGYDQQDPRDERTNTTTAAASDAGAPEDSAPALNNRIADGPPPVAACAAGTRSATCRPASGAGGGEALVGPAWAQEALESVQDTGVPLQLSDGATSTTQAGCLAEDRVKRVRVTTDQSPGKGGQQPDVSKVAFTTQHSGILPSSRFLGGWE